MAGRKWHTGVSQPEPGDEQYGSTARVFQHPAGFEQYQRYPCSERLKGCTGDIAKARADNRTSLTEIESKKLFAAYGLPVTEINLATSEDEAVALAEKTGYPIVMKVVSPDILHKSDAGGVKVNIKDADTVRSAYKEITASCKPTNRMRIFAASQSRKWHRSERRLLSVRS